MLSEVADKVNRSKVGWHNVLLISVSSLSRDCFASLPFRVCVTFSPLRWKSKTNIGAYNDRSTTSALVNASALVRRVGQIRYFVVNSIPLSTSIISECFHDLFTYDHHTLYRAMSDTYKIISQYHVTHEEIKII